jgi:hypothetical protein
LSIIAGSVGGIIIVLPPGVVVGGAAEPAAPIGIGTVVVGCMTGAVVMVVGAGVLGFSCVVGGATVGVTPPVAGPFVAPGSELQASNTTAASVAAANARALSTCFMSRPPTLQAGTAEPTADQSITRASSYAVHPRADNVTARFSQTSRTLMAAVEVALAAIPP